MEKGVKKGLGSAQDVTDRHISLRKDKTKQNREAKRRQHRESGDDIVSLIRELHVNFSLKLLERILLMGEAAEPYFDESNMFPETSRGPFIFPDGSKIIASLIYLVNTSKDIAQLECVTTCLINISAHSEATTWTIQLEPLIDGAVRIIESDCPSATVKENLCWVMANMCQDGGRRRDAVLNRLNSSPGGQKYLTTHDAPAIAGYLFSSLFKQHPLPPISSVGWFWKAMVQQLAQGGSGTASGSADIEHAVYLMVVANETSYKKALLMDGIFWNHLQRRINSDSSPKCAEILTRLATPETAPILLERGVVIVYVGLLNHQNPAIRFEAIKALSQLAECASCISVLCEPTILNGLQTQMANTDVWKIRKLIHRTIYLIIKTCHLTHTAQAYYPLLIERGCVKYICDGLVCMDEQVKLDSLEAANLLHKYEPKATRGRLEEWGGLDAIENDFCTHSNDRVRVMAEEIVDV